MGLPKGCMHSYRSTMATIVGPILWIKVVESDEILLASLPFFHVIGMQGTMNGPLYQGHTLVLMVRWDRR